MTEVLIDCNNENSSLLATAVAPTGYGSQSLDPEERTTMVNTTDDRSKKFPQYIAALSAAGGALAAGVVLGWTAPAEKGLITKDEYGFKVSEEQFSWIGAVLTLGAASVCMPIGFLINLIGRKLTMLLLVIPFSIGWALLIWAQNVEMMYAARFLLGVSGGAFCVTAPMYTGEIAQKEIRGTLGSFFQLMITIGILFVYIIGGAVNVFLMSIICGLIPILFGVIFFFMPETPLYLVSKGKDDAARASIKWLRGNEYDTEPELRALQEEHNRSKQRPVSVGQALSRKATIRGLCVSLGLMFFQQLSGINAVIFYTTKIFQAAKTGINDDLATILVGVMQVIATFVSTMVVDRLGRRILLLASDGVMAICTILMGVYFYLQEKNPSSVENLGWLPVACLCLFIVMFSIGFGPVPWLMMGELFAPDIKGLAGSIAGTVNWVLAFIVTKTFVNLLNGIGSGGTFWLFSGISVIGTIFVWFVVPETKGKSLEEIQVILGGDSGTPNTANLTTPEAKV